MKKYQNNILGYLNTMIEVTLSNDTKFNCEDGVPILSAAAGAQVVLPYSCRTGQCGACLVKVLSGETEVLIDEIYVQENDVEEGCILTCCRSAASNLVLDAISLNEFNGYEPRTLPARIDQLAWLSDDCLSVILRTPPTSALNYLPGQYVDLIVSERLRRSYSLASKRREDGKLELQIKIVAGGEMSEFFRTQASVGQLVRIRGPLGTFALRANTKKNIIMLATGTGIAPIKAIIEGLCVEDKFKQFDDIQVYWGNRYEQDLYEAQLPTLSNLTVTKVLSRGAKSWQGPLGYVQDVALDDKLDLTTSTIYACGSEDMIIGAKHKFLAAGMQASDFHFDAFVSSGRE